MRPVARLTSLSKAAAEHAKETKETNKISSLTGDETGLERFPLIVLRACLGRESRQANNEDD